MAHEPQPPPHDESSGAIPSDLAELDRALALLARAEQSAMPGALRDRLCLMTPHAPPHAASVPADVVGASDQVDALARTERESAPANLEESVFEETRGTLVASGPSLRLVGVGTQPVQTLPARGLWRLGSLRLAAAAVVAVGIGVWFTMSSPFGRSVSTAGAPNTDQLASSVDEEMTTLFEILATSLTTESTEDSLGLDSDSINEILNPESL